MTHRFQRIQNFCFSHLMCISCQEIQLCFPYLLCYICSRYIFEIIFVVKQFKVLSSSCFESTIQVLNLKPWLPQPFSYSQAPFSLQKRIFCVVIIFPFSLFLTNSSVNVSFSALPYCCLTCVCFPLSPMARIH